MLRCPRRLVPFLFLMVAACHEAPLDFVTVAVDRGDIEERVTASGTVSARTKVNVGSQISGTVAAVCVERNERVTQGQVLAQLDARVLDAQWARAEATWHKAQAERDRVMLQREDAQRFLNRTQKLVSDHMAAAVDLEAATLALASAEAVGRIAEATVREAYADLTLARTNRKLSRIISPIDGVVLDRQVEVGQTVAAQFQVATLFTLAADLTQVEVLVAIDEADMGRVVPPMPVHFTADAYRGRVFDGVLRTVRPAPVGFAGVSEGPSQATVVTYLGHIDAANDDRALWEGMTVQVDFVTAAHRNVVRVPTAALRYRPTDGAAGPADNPHEGQTLYTVGPNHKPVAHAVTLGLSDGRYTEVVEGFTDGEVIVRQRGGTAPAAGRRRGH